MARPAINPNDVGDLVPMLKSPFWRPEVTDQVYNAHLKELVHKTPAVRKRWTAHRLPLAADTFFSKNLSGADYVCAVQLTGNTVGVLKIAPVTGHCTLFLRLKRAEWLAWADKNKVDRTNTEYAFHKTLDPKLGAMILRSARAFELGPTGVHHPWVLALLCTMSSNDWLDYVVERDSSYDDPTNKIGHFSLVALPPLPAEFEQCLGIMGHSAAFVKDDDDLSLSSRSGTTALAARWGTHVAGGLVVDSCAHLFEQGAANLDQSIYADEKLFTETLPDLDQNTKYGKEVLDHLRSLAEAGTASTSTAAAPSAAPAAAPAAAPTAAPSAPAASAGNGSLLDSDDDNSDDGDDRATPNPTTPPRPPTPPSQPEAPAAPKKRSRPASKATAQRKKKPASSDSDEDAAEDDHDSSEEDETSEEEDDDDSSSDEDAAGGDGGAVSASSSPAAVAVSTTTTTTTTTTAAAATASEPSFSAAAAPALPGLMSDPALLSVLAEMARPCCARLKKLKRNHHGVGLKVRHHNQLIDDLKLLEEATSPVALLAAALNIINTLADIQSDRFRGDAVLVRCSEAERLCALATQAGEFAMGVRELLKDAHTSADPQ